MLRIGRLHIPGGCYYVTGRGVVGSGRRSIIETDCNKQDFPNVRWKCEGSGLVICKGSDIVRDVRNHGERYWVGEDGAAIAVRVCRGFVPRHLTRWSSRGHLWNRWRSGELPVTLRGGVWDLSLALSCLLSDDKSLSSIDRDAWGELSLTKIKEGFPMDWIAQRKLLGFST